MPHRGYMSVTKEPGQSSPCPVGAEHLSVALNHRFPFILPEFLECMVRLRSFYVYSFGGLITLMNFKKD
jgi:hypothetical protein